MAGDPQAYAANPRQLANPVPGVAEQGSLDAFMAQQKVPNAPAQGGTPTPALAAPQAAAPQQQAAAPGGDDSLDAFLAKPGQFPSQPPGAPQLPEQDQHTADKAAAQQGYIRGVDGKMHPAQSLSDTLGAGWKAVHDMMTLPREDMLKKMRENIASGEGDGGSKWLANAIVNNTIGMPDQVHDLDAQTIANVGRSGLAKQQLLEKQLGKGNVQVGSDGAISFRYPGEKEFRPLGGSPGLQILGDTVGNPRQMFKEVITDVPATLAGGIAYGLTGGAGAGTVPGVMAGTRALMQTPANYILDKFEEAQGASHDANRSRLAENLMDTGVEAGFGALNTLVRYAIPGTDEFERRMQRKALNEVTLTEQAKDLALADAHVTNSGAFQSVDLGIVSPSLAGKKLTIRSDQLFQNDAQVMRDTALAAPTPQFQNVQTAQVNNVVEAVKNMSAKISQYVGGDASNDVERFSSIVKGIDTAEGKTIGSFRAKAMAQIGNEKLPVPQELQQQAAGMMQELGFTVRAGGDSGKLTYVPPADMRPLMGKFGITKMGDMRSFVNALQDYANTSGTGLRIDEIDRLVNTTGNLNGAAGRIGGQVASSWGQFTGGLRQFRRDAIGAGLVNDIDIRGYNQAMDKFGALRDASNTVSKVLDGDFTSNAIVQQVFSKGQSGLENLRAVKTLVAEDAPQTWAALKQSWMDDMFRRYSNPKGPVPFNFAGMQKELASYGDTFLNEALDGSGVTRKDVSSLMLVAQSIQNTYRSAGAPAGLDEKAKQGLFNSAVGVLGGMHFKVVNGLQQAFGIGVPGNPLTEVFNPDKLALRLSKYTGPGDKAIIEDNVKQLMGTAAVVRGMPRALRAADYTMRNLIKNKVEPKGTPAQAPEEEQPQ